ncbi:YdeI/OmpD-associated family protein [Lederbergia panacisoli]|uniref:YdeI/OmpD-associated family protein n=1 Tax=Lederbergia panacisoli TaxID=1255251 RepID=UPI00214BE370|nr:YdeI/OmpD-associated family protein [Lederbergia panacisoli]MCR2822269.1 YdeI/OmpD-associated family protein [Lederbergia panacisoli]
MSKFSITYVPQPDFSACDEACLAMVARIPIEEAVLVMKGTRGPGSTHFYGALKKYKIDYLSWRKVDDIKDLPPLCVLLVQFPTYGHSVVYYDGVFYDPEFGVLESYTPKGKITHFMELFIEEVYESKHFDIKIPNDFIEAFENDQEAYNIFKKLPYPQKSKCINGISHYKNPGVRKKNIEKILVNLKKQGESR